MRNLAVLTFVTLDGVMQAPSMAGEDTSGDFTQGGWAAPYWEDVMPHVAHAAMAEPYDIVFGRKTYDTFASHWPNMPRSALSDQLNGARKYVVTSRADKLNWANSLAITGNIPAALNKLKREDGPLLQVHGSATLIQTLLAADLVDEFRIWTFPVVVGEGKRLFEPGMPSRTLKLIAADLLDCGVTMHVYRPSR